MGKLDVNKLKNGFDYIPIGKLSTNIINLLGLKIKECEIGMFGDRLKYIEKHKDDFYSEEDFWKYTSSIPEVISNPEYVAVHPSKSSIEFIKRYDKLFLVAVRIKKGAKLYFRTAYPITQEQLESYISSGTAIKVGKSSWHNKNNML